MAQEPAAFIHVAASDAPAGLWWAAGQTGDPPAGTEVYLHYTDEVKERLHRETGDHPIDFVGMMTERPLTEILATLNGALNRLTLREMAELFYDVNPALEPRITFRERFPDEVEEAARRDPGKVLRAILPEDLVERLADNDRVLTSDLVVELRDLLGRGKDS